MLVIFFVVVLKKVVAVDVLNYEIDKAARFCSTAHKHHTHSHKKMKISSWSNIQAVPLYHATAFPL